MINTADFLDKLLENGTEQLAGVPCSFLSPLINEALKRHIYEPFLNEGDAVAYAAGRALAGKKCAVIMQNSGISNALSPLTSLTELFGLHILLIIGNRGSDDEPQHRIMAGAVKPFLNTIGIPYFDAEDGESAIAAAFSALQEHSAAILVNRRDTFSNAEPPYKQGAGSLLRYDVLKEISQYAEDSVILTTTGYTSREMYSIKDSAKNFYMVGSMGCLSSLTLGVAKSVPNKRIIAIDGDSAFLMRLSGLYTVAEHKPSNLCYILLDNNGNESTGGQINSRFNNRVYDIMTALHPTAEINGTAGIKTLLADFRAKREYTQAYIPIKMGTLKNLPRPERGMIFEQAKRFRNEVHS